MRGGNEKVLALREENCCCIFRVSLTTVASGGDEKGVRGVIDRVIVLRGYVH